MDNRAIGVFDSGLGGLSCVRSIMDIMPGEDIIYFGDTGRVPYGTRSRETIVKYARQDINFLRTFDIKQIIIACGTASSTALPCVAEDYDIDIIGVVEPAAKAAVEGSRSGRIGVIGTSATIRSGKYEQSLTRLCPEVHAVAAACPLFVPLVENGYAAGDVARQVARDYLEPLVAAEVDTVILGCTHYPLLGGVIREVLGENVTLIDAGEQAARCSYERLRDGGMLNGGGGMVRYFVSDSVENFAQLGGIFLQTEISGSVEKIDIEIY